MKVRKMTQEQRISALGKRINKIYAQAHKELAEKVDSFYAKFAAMDEKKRKLVKEGKLSETEYKTWRKNKMLMGKDYEHLRDNVGKTMVNADKMAAAYINREIIPSYATGYNLEGQKASDAIVGYSFDLIDENAVKRLTTSNKTILPYKIVDGRRMERWNTKMVNSAILQGIIQGEPLPLVMKRLMNVTKMNKTSARRNAQTALTGAHNSGRQDAMERLSKDGVIIKKEWLAQVGDGRTREAHLELHHVVVDYDKPFENSIGKIMFPGDPNAHPANVYNCRCAIATQIVGFKGKKQKTEAEVKEEEYQEVLKEREKAQEDFKAAEAEFEKVKEEHFELAKLKQAYNSNMGKYDQFETYDDYKQYRDELNKRYAKISDEYYQLKRPKYSQYPEGPAGDAQYERDLEAYRKKREELREKMDALDTVVYEEFPSWDEVKRYRKAREMGMDEIDRRFEDTKARGRELRGKMDEAHARTDAVRTRIATDYPVEDAIHHMESNGVEYISPEKRKVADIIGRVAGGDETEGSCASLGYCYAAQKDGYDVLDFRDGVSRETFASRTNVIMEYFGRKHEGSFSSVTAKAGTTAGHKLLHQVQPGKEYYFTVGQHAAIVRKNENGWIEYLEMQSGREGGNGWQGLGDNDKLIDEMLKWRFNAPSRNIGWDQKACMLDIDCLRGDSQFQRMMGYINTAEGSQKKGAWGHER